MSSTVLARDRASLGGVFAGLILRGLTAFPLLTAVRSMARLFGIANAADYQRFGGLFHWIAFVLYGLETIDSRFPFIAYGTDWLAFGHLCIAVFFVRAYQKPLECDWVLRCGSVCCAGVIPLALIAGQVRGIPLYWRLIDCSFGIFGAIPLWYCLRLTRRMREE